MLKKILTIILVFTFFTFSKGNSYAVCEQNCNCDGDCGQITCQSIGAFDNSTYFQEEIDGCAGTWVMTCYNVNITEDIDAYIDPNSETAFTPGSYEQLVCDYNCVMAPNPWGTEACIMEDQQLWCDCGETGTPTPTATPDPDNPTEPPTSTPTPEPRTITGNTYVYDGAGLVGSFCGGQATQETIEPSVISIGAISGSNNVTGGFHVGSLSQYTINLTNSPTGLTWDVTLSLNENIAEGEKLVCGCPAPLDPADPYTCQYSGVADDISGVDFYLIPYNLANASWFQVFGGNAYATSGIRSLLPVADCVLDGSCEDSLIAKSPGSLESMSSGFALTSSDVNTTIRTSLGVDDTRSYINTSDRTENLNAYATSVDINPIGYLYFENLLDGEIDITSSDTQMDLNTLRADANWDANELNVIQFSGDLNIDENMDWNVTSGENIVVLVDGNLTVSDSTPDALTDKIISVAEGGFLAFLSDNNITFDESIGYYIDPNNPSIVPVNNTNANVEGVFIADNDITVDARDVTTISDRKFIAAGTYVAWNNVNLDRDFDDGNVGRSISNSQAVENFIFRPDLVLNWPTELKDTSTNWRQVNPQMINY